MNDLDKIQGVDSEIKVPKMVWVNIYQPLMKLADIQNLQNH
jgi:hypothetical protein